MPRDIGHIYDERPDIECSCDWSAGDNMDIVDFDCPIHGAPALRIRFRDEKKTEKPEKTKTFFRLKPGMKTRWRHRDGSSR